MYLTNLFLMSGNFIFCYLSSTLGEAGFSHQFIALAQAIPRLFSALAILFFWNKICQINKLTFILFSTIAGIISFTGLTFSQNYWMIIIFSILYSFPLFSMLAIAVPSLMDYTPPQKRRAIISMFTSSNSFGGLVGPLSEGLMISLAIIQASGVHIIAGIFYFILAFIAIILANFFVRFLEPVHYKEDLVENQKPPESQLTNFKTYKLVIPLIFFLGAFFFTQSNTLPIYIDNQFSPTIFFLGFAIFSITVRIFLAPKLRVWNSRRVLIVNFSLYCLSFSLLAVLPIYSFAWILFLSGVFFGISHGVLFPLITALFVNITPSKPTNANLVLSLFYFIGGGIMPALLGVFATVFNYQIMFLFLIVLGIVIILYTTFSSQLKQLLLSLDENVQK